jgi:hypothetical protein
MRRSLLILIFLVAILIVPTALADVEVNVRTLPDHKVSVFVLKPVETYSLIDSAHTTSDGSGLASAAISGGSDTVKINVKISKDSETIIFEKFEEEFTIGSPVHLQVIPENISTNYLEMDQQRADEEAAQQAEEEEAAAAAVEAESTVEIEDQEAEGPKITGKVSSIVTSVKSGIFSKTSYILIGAILTGAVLLFIIRSRISVPTLSNLRGGGEVLTRSKVEQELEEAEKDIEEARSKIRQIKNEDKIKQAKKKLDEDKARLERLEKGEDDED